MGVATTALAQLEVVLREVGRGATPPPPSRTKWTRLVHPSVLTGHVSSLSPIKALLLEILLIFPQILTSSNMGGFAPPRPAFRYNG